MRASTIMAPTEDSKEPSPESAVRSDRADDAPAPAPTETPATVFLFPSPPSAPDESSQSSSADSGASHRDNQQCPPPTRAQPHRRRLYSSFLSHLTLRTRCAELG